jgi:hypothetical protein
VAVLRLVSVVTAQVPSDCGFGGYAPRGNCGFGETSVRAARLVAMGPKPRGPADEFRPEDTDDSLDADT